MKFYARIDVGSATQPIAQHGMLGIIGGCVADPTAASAPARSHGRTSRPRHTALGVTLLLMCTFSGLAAEPKSIAPIPASGDAMYEVKLKGGAEGMNIVLLLTAEQGRWQRVWGYHYQMGNGLCHGYITSAQITPAAARWNIVLQMPGDVLNRVAHFGQFSITAERMNADGPSAATYDGRIGIRPAYRGEAVVTRLPFPPRRPGYTPLAVGEHPRLLFRKADIPVLRKRLETAFGQAARAIFEKSQDPAALGVLYQLTGDRKYADQARAPFEKELEDQGYGMNGTGHVWAGRMFAVSIAWDCLREAWEPAFNAKVADTLQQRCEMLFFNSGGNMAATSNWAGPRNCAAGMASLCLAGDAGEGPPDLFSLDGPVTKMGLMFHPTRIGIYRSDQPLVLELSALQGKTGAEWSIGKPFQNWVWSGFLNVEFKGNQDLMSGLGGSAKAMPVEGATCNTTIFTAEGPNDIVIRFSKLPAEMSGKDGLDAAALLAGGIKSGKMILSSMFQVAADTPIRCVAPGKAVKVWIDATPMSGDQVYLLKAGAHRALVSVNITPDSIPAGRMDPELTDAGATLSSVKEGLGLFAAHERGDWEAKGKPDFDKDYLVEAGRMYHYQYCWLGMGDGGFFAESGGYSHYGGYGVYAYGLMHWNVLGRLVSGRGDIARYVPRHVFSNPVGEAWPGSYHKGSRLCGLAIHGLNYPVATAYTRSFPFLDPKLQPACLWLWQQDLGIDPVRPETALKHDPVATFFTYPLDMASAPPSTPTWPLTWASQYRGWYGFRSGFRGAAEDALVQCYAKASNEMGWSQSVAGTIAVQACGQQWTVCQNGREQTRNRETLVHLPNAAKFGSGWGMVRDYRTEPDGSGSLAIDLRQVYAEPLDGPRPPFIDKNGMLERGVREPLGPITRGRFLAVDYSGKAGCPVVLAIIDRIDGLSGQPRYWQWMQPEDLNADTKFGPRDFTVTTPNATLRANFVHPAKPELKRAGEVSIMAPLKRREKPVGAPIPKKAEMAGVEGLEGEAAGINPEATAAAAKTAFRKEACEGPGAMGNDHFFVVVTIGPGTPPAVEVKGTGLESIATVGGRQYRFDGERIVMEDRGK